MSYCYRILHIADPHFSNCHFIGAPAEVGARHAQEVKEALKKDDTLSSPFDAVVLSGDFTFACRTQGFQAAEVFIDTLMGFKTDSDEPLIRRNGLIVIPGNHDIDLSKPVVIKNLSLPTSKEESEAPFREFLARIEKYVGPSNHWLSTVNRFEGKDDGEGRGLVIMALNSCRAERRDAQGWGYVGMDQIHNAASRLLRAPHGESRAQPGDVILAVTHHNPLPIWDLGLETLGHVPDQRKFSFTMDAGGTFNFLADLGVSVILHGHTHIQSVKAVSGYASEQGSQTPTLVLGCGSLGIKCSGTEPIPAHHFQVIEIATGDRTEDVWLRYQDFSALFRLPDTRREWTSTLLREDKLVFTRDPKKRESQLGAPWDPARVESVLKAKLFQSNQAAYDSEVMESWSVLRTRKLRPADWPGVLDGLCRRVLAIDKTAKGEQIAAAVERLFKDPPVEQNICKQTLEEYLKQHRPESSSARALAWLRNWWKRLRSGNGI